MSTDLLKLGLIVCLLGCSLLLSHSVYREVKVRGTSVGQSVPVQTVPVQESAYLQPKAPPYLFEETKSYAVLTAYNSLEEQTDSTPFITASGERVNWGTVACNWLPLGTKIKIPEYFGNKTFKVTDRMNDRYSLEDRRIDVWMPEYDQAVTFGLQRSQIKILKVK